jgi:hypothetical protein
MAARIYYAIFDAYPATAACLWACNLAQQQSVHLVYYDLVLKCLHRDVPLRRAGNMDELASRTRRRPSSMVRNVWRGGKRKTASVAVNAPRRRKLTSWL